MPLSFIPSPSANGFSVGPLFFHAYGIAYVFAVIAAIIVSRWGWKRMGGDPDLCYEVAMWAFPAGLIGGRIYFLITTPSQIPDHWWGPFAIWKGGLGIWGGIAAGAAVGLYVASRRLSRAELRLFMDVVAPGLLCAQAIGRIGNYFNQELFGGPTKLPWGLEISRAHRVAQLAPKYWNDTTFQPTFLYEMIWNLALAGFLVWLVQTRRVRAAGRLRAVRRRLLGLPDLRGDAADRLLQPHLRPAVELLRRVDPMSARACLVRRDPARLAWIGRPDGRADSGSFVRAGAEAQARAEGAAAPASPQTRPQQPLGVRPRPRAQLGDVAPRARVGDRIG